MPGKSLGDLEKSVTLLIETGSTVNASESKREQSGIIRWHFRGIKRREQFFEVPLYESQVRSRTIVRLYRSEAAVRGNPRAHAGCLMPLFLLERSGA
jgi:hypothetical protein